jgi:hypothetical protein
MAQALALARRGLYTTAPNPRVGCVIARGEHVIGERLPPPRRLRSTRKSRRCGRRADRRWPAPPPT